MSENGDILFPLGGSRHMEPSLGDFRDGKPAFIPFPSDSHVVHPSEYKISFPASMVNGKIHVHAQHAAEFSQEAQIRKLKLSMETWREVIIEANNILLWEKPWHSTALLSASSTIFILMYFINPSTLTILAFIGLLITLGDSFLSPVLASIFKAEGWTKDKQKQYEEVCTNIIMYKTKIELVCSSYYRMRVTNSKVYCTVTIFVLCVLIWIGSTIDNLFLMYLLCTFLMMLPGLLHHGMLGKISDTFSKLFNELIENAKSKVGSVKKVQ